MLTLTWVTDILFDKLSPETGGMNLKNTLCTMPIIFSGDPKVDGLIIGLYQFCMIIGQTRGEGTI